MCRKESDLICKTNNSFFKSTFTTKPTYAKRQFGTAEATIS